MTKLRPCHDNVLLARKDPEKVTASGIILAEAAQKKNHLAEVLAVGPGRYDELGDRVPPVVKPGDVVVLAEWTGVEIELDGRKVLMVKESELLAIVEEL